MHAAALIFLGIAISGPASAANLIKDGGFEKPTTPAGSYIVYNPGQTFGPWTVVGTSGNVNTISTTLTENGFTFTAHKGLASMDLTGFDNAPTGVAQTVRTTAGTAYTLTFWVGNVYDPGGIFGTTSTVNVYNGSTLLISATNTGGMGSTMQVWKKFSVTFTASGKSTLSFVNGDPSNDTLCGLDDISLAQARAR